MNDTQKLIIPVALLTVGVLLGAWHALPQAAPSKAPDPTATPQRLKGTISPGGVYRFTPAPIAGTPEPNPTLALQIVILDADTGQPVQADVLINNVLARSGVDRAEFRLPGRTDGITVTVRADGYVPWSQVLRYKLDHSRVLYLQAELTPLTTLLPPPLGEPVLSEAEGGWGGGSQPPTSPLYPTPTPTSAQPIIALASPLPALSIDTPAPAAALAPPDSPILPTPSPSPHPLTPLTPSVVPSVDSWWSWPCNTPPHAFPDGCETAGEADVAPPDYPLTPPCIRTAYTRTVPNDDYPDLLDIELTIVVDHPEYPHYTPGRDTQFVRLVLQPTYGGWHADHWQLGDPDWWFKCGLDEAPLAWALMEALNTHSLASFDIAYNASLPTPFVDFIVDLIESEEPTPMPKATLTPAPTIDSPLPTPTP